METKIKVIFYADTFRQATIFLKGDITKDPYLNDNHPYVEQYRDKIDYDIKKYLAHWVRKISPEYQWDGHVRLLSTEVLEVTNQSPL